MTTITLESIQAAQTRINELIDAYAQQQTDTSYVVPEATIILALGERYAGIVLDDNGEPLHHLILLPGEAQDHNWDDAMAWAKGVDGELPTRQEQALLYANLKSAFKPSAYWSVETHAKESSSAWYQGFGYGFQLFYPMSAQLRAVAVRRLVID
jgi:hypothetical protein